MSDDLLTSTQAGAILGRSARTITRLADAGDLAYAQKLPGPNGAYLFRRSEVERARDEYQAERPTEAAS